MARGVTAWSSQWRQTRRAARISPDSRTMSPLTTRRERGAAVAANESSTEMRSPRWCVTYTPRMKAIASSTACSSLASRRPAEPPKRSGSTTVVCSTRTLVGVPSSVIVGLKLAGRAAVEVGETSTVLSPRNSSAWTITAKRALRCSWPRVCRGDGNRKISPRITGLGSLWRQRSHLLADGLHLCSICLVRCEPLDLRNDRGARATVGCRLAQRRPNRLGVAQSITTDDIESSDRTVIQTYVQRATHNLERSTYCATFAGAEAMLAERQQDAEGIERLVEHSTSTDPGFDVDIAQRIDELAWGQHRVPFADALIAAAAQDAGVDALHYNHHYDRLALALHFTSVWVAPPGALEQQTPPDQRCGSGWLTPSS